MHVLLEGYLRQMLQRYNRDEGVVDLLVVALVTLLIWVLATGRRIVVQ